MTERVTLSGQDRRRSLEQAAAGGALFGAGAGGAELANRRLKRKGQQGQFRAAYASMRGRPGGLSVHHVPHVAAKLGTRALQGVGLPLAAYGAVNAVRARPHATRELDLKRDIVAPVANRALYADQVAAGEAKLRAKVGKALTETEQRKLGAHRRFGRAAALVGGTLGLGALATRAPSGAKLLARKVPGRPLAAIARHEENATKLSNTLGVTAIGTGSAGSFNYAAQQKLERKREPVAKDDRRRPVSGGAIAGAGATTAGIGLVGGGLPGFRSKPDVVRQIMDPREPKARRAGAALSSGRGGIFGWRAEAHQSFLRRSESGERRFAGQPATRPQMFKRGRTAGKIGPEKEIIRHMKVGRGVSNAALVGGGAATVYGLRRASGQQVRKGQDDVRTYHGALLGGGLTALAATSGGAALAGHQQRRWAARERASLHEAGRVVPNTRGIGAYEADEVTGNKAILAGKSKAQAHQAGAHFGAAAQHRYFSDTYGATAKVARKLRYPAAAAAAVGAGGLLASRKVSKAFPQQVLVQPVTTELEVVKADSGYDPAHSAKPDRFLRRYGTRISPQAESGYRYLKAGRNRQASQAVGAGTMAGLGGWLTAHELRATHGVSRPAAAIAAAGTLGSAYTAATSGRGAVRWNARMGRIKAKARQREHAGLYGPGRGLLPADERSS